MSEPIKLKLHMFPKSRKPKPVPDGRYVATFRFDSRDELNAFLARFNGTLPSDVGLINIRRLED